MLESIEVVPYVKVYCDQREREVLKHASKWIATYKTIEIVQTTQEIGDYIIVQVLVDGTEKPLAVIERKTLLDQAASIVDGRHQKNKPKLLAFREKWNARIFYLIEGLPTRGAQYGTISGGTLINSFLHLIIRDNIQIMYALTAEECFRMVCDLATSFQSLMSKGEASEQQQPPLTMAPAAPAPATTGGDEVKGDGGNTASLGSKGSRASSGSEGGNAALAADASEPAEDVDDEVRTVKCPELGKAEHKRDLDIVIDMVSNVKGISEPKARAIISHYSIWDIAHGDLGFPPCAPSEIKLNNRRIGKSADALMHPTAVVLGAILEKAGGIGPATVEKILSTLGPDLDRFTLENLAAVAHGRGTFGLKRAERLLHLLHLTTAVHVTIPQLIPLDP